MGERFVTDFMQPALFVDGADYHHGMTSHVQTPAEIKSIFDFIIYDKGKEDPRGILKIELA